MRCIFLLLTVFSLSTCTSPPQGSDSAKTPPNIIFILADDLGYGDLGCYGQEMIRTPNIDQLAKNGMRFTNHYAGSTVCAPSRCVLMTGLHTGHARIRGNRDVPLVPEDTTVAEILQGAGYVTGMFGKWGLGEAGTTGVPNAQGFNQFVGYLNQIRAHNAYTDWLWSNEDTLWLDNEVEIVTESYAKGIGSVSSVRNTHTQDLFTAEALKFIEQNRDTSFFLYLPYTLPHANNEAWFLDAVGMEVPELMGYDSITEWNESQQAFAAAISYMHRDVGRIMSHLETLGLTENTLVIFTSDNGPHKEGGNDPEVSNSSGPLRGIKRDLYEGGIRVPFIAHWPEKISPGTVSNHVSTFWDFLPTVTELIGFEVPFTSDGISYLPELLGHDQPTHDYLYWEFFEQGGKQAVRIDQWKGVKIGMSGDVNAPIELYDLSNDLGEQTNVADANPEITQRLEDQMKKARSTSADFRFEHEE